VNDLFLHLRNKLFSTPPAWADYNVLLVALGDSVTQGLTVNPRVLGEQSYHALVRRRLARRFPERSFSTVNAGVGGNSACDALDRLDRDVLDRHPDLVTVCLGLNDCDRGDPGLPRFRSDLTAIVRRIHAADVPVILLTPNMLATRCVPPDDPDRSESAPRRTQQQTSGLLARYVDVIRAVARDTHTPLADVYAEWDRRHNAGEDTTMLLANRSNHPGPQGHRIFADVLFNTIISTLTPRPESTA
jgi:lysophospholipase L1-like esterase